MLGCGLTPAETGGSIIDRSLNLHQFPHKCLCVSRVVLCDLSVRPEAGTQEELVQSPLQLCFSQCFGNKSCSVCYQRRAAEVLHQSRSLHRAAALTVSGCQRLDRL